MLRNYLLTAIRNLSRNKTYAFLNVLGLALGIGCASVIFKVVLYETSFDKHQENYESIYRVVHQNIYPDRIDKGQGTPHPVGPTLKEDYPELKYVVRTHYAYGDQINIKDERGEMKKFLIEEGIAFTENEYFKMFSTEWVAGDPETALLDPKTVVITESIARSLFGLGEGQESLAMGRMINYNNREDFKVVGVIKDPPENTNFVFTMMFEYHSALLKISPYYGEGKRWNSTSSNTNTYFVPVDTDGFDPEAFNSSLVEMVEKYVGEGESEEIRYLVQPLADMHFSQDYDNNTSTTSIEFLISLGIIGIFLVLTACINFINLATAQAANRSKEIGIRKAIGGLSGQLALQFMAEIATITLIAVLLSLAISEIMFILVEDIIGYRLTLELVSEPIVPAFLLGLFVVVTILSGFYPAFLLSRMNTVMALKNSITAKQGSGGLILRKGLVVAQFVITQFLIIGTLIVTAQMKYFQSKDLGFVTDAIVTTYLPERDAVKRERFKQEMLASSAISDITFSLSQPTGNSNSHSNFNYAPLESEVSYNGNFKPVDERFIEFYDLDILAGRSVQKGDSNNLVVNQMVADLMGFKENYDGALGEKLNTGWGGDKNIVGVVENFHAYSLGREMDYVLFLHAPDVFYSISFKVESMESIESALSHFRASWENVYPEYVNDYDFYDEEIAERYEYEQSISALMRIFAVISILIGCLGLYGLISFIAINKTKEVGVRKVLGASAFNILGIFSKEITVLILIAFLIATPSAYYAMTLWLEEYAFRIDMNYTYFMLALLITFVIAILTISHRTVTTAYLNPASTLKDE